MTVRQPRYSKEEFARRGDEIYESQVRPQIEEGNYGKIVAIDIETGAFEVADEILTATDRLFKRLPDAPTLDRPHWTSCRSSLWRTESEKTCMMHGVVNLSCEATISLVVSNASRQTRLIDAVIDTGYTGYLSLPREIIVALNLPWTGIDRGTLGDGSEVTFEVYAATVIWDGQYRNIPVTEAETDPLVGMSLLYGYDLQIRAVEGGNVTIKAIE